MLCNSTNMKNWTKTIFWIKWSPVVYSFYLSGFLKLTTEKGISCGGWYIFAEICRSNNDCCEEQIVTGTQAFNGGETIQTNLQHCKNFVNSSTTGFQQNRLHLTAKLTGWNDMTVSLIKGMLDMCLLT